MRTDRYEIGRSSRHLRLALAKSINFRRCGRCAIVLKNGLTAIHFEGCAGCIRGYENTSRVSSLRSTAVSRRAIYPAVRYLPEMSTTEQTIVSAGGILPSCTSKEEARSDGDAGAKELSACMWRRLERTSAHCGAGLRQGQRKE